MNSTTTNKLIFLSFSFNAVLTAFGFMVLFDSPYTGIRMSVCGDAACVESVDRNSPADRTMKHGDRLIAVETMDVPPGVFSSDPDYIASRNDQRIFWESQYSLAAIIHKNRPARFRIVRNGKPIEISLTPGNFPFLRTLTRSLPQYFVGWTFLIVAYLVLRKHKSDITKANFIIGTFACAAFSTLAPYCVRDIVFSPGPFKTLTTANYVASQTFCYALFHILLVFPRQKAVLQGRPWVIAVPYVFLGSVVSAHYLGVFENTHVTTYMSMNLCLLASFSAFVYDFIREKHPVYRKQIQWIVFGSLAGITSWLTLTSLPIVFGMPYFSQEISILPTVIYPLSFAFAVTKYRLMEIDSILDTAVVYGFTIIILAGVEMTFLSFASPYLLSAGLGLPAFSVVTVLLIVFVYVPIRNMVKGMVERLFKRGKYDPEKELQQFTVSLGLCDERSALEKFSVFVMDLLRPSGMIVLKIGDRTASILHANNDLSRNEGEKIESRAEEVWKHVRSKSACMFGYELSGKIGQDGVPFTPDLENALFVPFITDSADAGNGYLAVLLKKWNETAYSLKDVTLMNAISVNIANIIEAGELRKERTKIEKRHRKEKDAVMKELHDGLGNILTSVTVTSQAAERMLEKDKGKAKELVERIGEFTAEAMDFMRTGLTVLDDPQGDIGSMMECVKDRFAALFEAAALELRIECADEAKKLRPGAIVSMNLIRIIQESLTNIIKHSGARRAHIEVACTKEGMSVTVTDDGKGFDLAEKRAGYGLTNMRRRVEEMAGTMEITSTRENGAKIEFTIPLAGSGGIQEGAYAAGNR